MKGLIYSNWKLKLDMLLKNFPNVGHSADKNYLIFYDIIWGVLYLMSKGKAKNFQGINFY